MERTFITRYLLAGNVAGKVRNLYRLARHRNSKIRRHVAENPSCPKELLAILARDPHPDVRIAVALNVNSDLETRLQLSNDDSANVRFLIASTSYMPVQILNDLAQDENPYVQVRAKRTLNGLNHRESLGGDK